jgi:hypothetical protein
MTDGGAGYEPGVEEEGAVPFRSRSAYAGFRAFGGDDAGDGAVLLAPEVAHSLRSAAESATQERRITGGLLYGRSWADDEGTYLVIAGYLEAGPGENPDDQILPGGADAFTLSPPDLRLLRQDAARMYPASLEVGWWRTLQALGEFGPRDFETQAELVSPGGVGLLVYGSGQHWGTAYLGPEGLPPESAGTLVATAGAGGAPPPPVVPAASAPTSASMAAEAAEPHQVDLGAGEHVIQERAAPPPQRARRRPLTAPRTAPRVRMPRRVRRVAAARPASEGYGPPTELPTDVTLVVGLIALAVVAIAIIVGVLVSSLVVGLIIAVLGVLVVFSSVWMSRK